MNEPFPPDSAPGAAQRVAPRQRLLLFAAVGYGYLATLVTILILAGILALRTRFGILVSIPAGLLILVVWSVFLRLPVPEGRKLARADGPRLFDVIDEVRVASAAPPIHEVLLTADMNAWIVDVPRFGIFGSRRCLSIGLPLMQALPADELRAVLAHELAHLAHRHGRRRAWAARLGTTWSSLAASVQWTRNWAAFLFVPFFRWYAPRLRLAAESASRVDEHEADGLAARCAGRAAAGRALLRIALVERFAQRVFWPAIRRESAGREDPPGDAIVRFVDGMDGCLAHAQANVWIAALLRERALEDDSHPSLAERMAALGVPATPDRAGELVRILAHARNAGAAEALLGREAVHQYAVALSEQWSEATRKEWRRLRADAQLVRDREQGGFESAAADAFAARAQARWTAMCQPPDVAIPLLEAIVERLPDATEARLLLGHLLLDQDDAGAQRAGERLLEEVLVDESALALTAAQALRRHYARNGSPRDVERCLLRQQGLERACLAVLREQGSLRYRDELRAYPLPAAALATMREQLRSIPEIRRAYLVQKRTRNLRSTPVAVLAVEIGVPWYRPAFGTVETKVFATLAEQFSLPDSVDVILFPLQPKSRLQRRLRRLAGAEIYGRDQAGAELEVGAAEWSTPPRRLAFVRRPVFAIGGIVLGVFLLLSAGVALLASSMRDDDRVLALQRATRDHPDDAQAHLELTWALLEQGRLADALPVVRQAVRLAPKNADAHNSLGWILMQHRGLDSAMQSLQTAIRLDPEHRFAHLNLGWVLYDLERYEDAEAAFLEALRITPDNPDVHLGLAAVLADRRRFDEAKSELHAAIRLAPNEPTYRVELGLLLARQGRVEEALQVYRAALQIFPDNARFWREIGVLEHVQGRHATAIAAFREFKRLDPTTFGRDEVARKMLEASLAQRQYDG